VIRRLSLSQRLALVVSLLMLCAAAVCAVQLHSSAQYGNAMVQRLSSGWLSRLSPASRCWTPTAGQPANPEVAV
jgi:hypothetical protein